MRPNMTHTRANVRMNPTFSKPETTNSLQTRRNAMLNNYERHLIFSYLSNAVSHFRHYHTEAKELAEWVAENRDVLAINDVTEELGERRSYHAKGLPEQDWRLFTKALEETRSASRHVRGDRTTLRLRRLGKEMHLTRTDVSILEILLRYRTQPIIESPDRQRLRALERHEIFQRQECGVVVPPRCIGRHGSRPLCARCVTCKIGDSSRLRTTAT